MPGPTPTGHFLLFPSLFWVPGTLFPAPGLQTSWGFPSPAHPAAQPPTPAFLWARAASWPQLTSPKEDFHSPGASWGISLCLGQGDIAWYGFIRLVSQTRLSSYPCLAAPAPTGCPALRAGTLPAPAIASNLCGLLESVRELRWEWGEGVSVLWQDCSLGRGGQALAISASLERAEATSPLLAGARWSEVLG